MCAIYASRVRVKRYSHSFQDAGTEGALQRGRGSYRFCASDSKAAASLPHSKGFAKHNAKSWKQSQEVIDNKGSRISLSAKTNLRMCNRTLEAPRFTLLSRPWWFAES
jgi:hypothetical protein